MKRGFSYIEVIIAVTVSAAIFSAVMPLLFGSVNINRDAREKLLAYEAASNQIESLRERKIASLVTPGHTPFTVEGIDDAIGDVYLARNLGDQNIVSAEVTVNWTLAGKAQKVELVTYLYGSTD